MTRTQLVHYNPKHNPNKKPDSICLRLARRINRKHNTPRTHLNRENLKVTSCPEDVTCKRCLKMIEDLNHPLAPDLRANTSPLIVADYLEERMDRPDLAQKLRLKILAGTERTEE